MNAALQALRDATADVHARMSASLDPELLCADRARYTTFLAALYGFHAGIEARLAEAPNRASALPLSPPRARSALLHDDLVQLSVDASALPAMPGVPELSTPAAAAGAAYVVEGSALGGILIGRMAASSLGIGPSSGGAFFALGAASGGRWGAVKQGLSAELPTAADRAVAARVAAALFAGLERWFAHHALLREVGGAAPAPRAA